MNERDLKQRLQNDAQPFREEFSELLLEQIMEEVQQLAKSEYDRKTATSFLFSAVRVVTVVASVLFGVGIWSLQNVQQYPTIINRIPNSTPDIQFSFFPTTDLMRSYDTDFQITPSRLPVGSLFEISVEPFSACNLKHSHASGTSSPQFQTIDGISSFVIPSRSFVRLRSVANENPSEVQNMEVQHQDAIADFWNDVTNVMDASITWIFEEE